MSSTAPAASFATSKRASQHTRYAAPLSTTRWLFAAYDASGGDLRRAHIYLTAQTASNAKAAIRVLVMRTKRVPGATTFAIDERSAIVTVTA